MTFWFGILVGWVCGIAFTVWCDRQRWNACPKGGFHYWQDGGPGLSTSRLCEKCGVDEEKNWWGQSI